MWSNHFKRWSRIKYWDFIVFSQLFHLLLLLRTLLDFFENLDKRYFQYMENEDEGKLVEFIISAESFAEQLPLTQSDEQAVEDAMIIYNRCVTSNICILSVRNGMSVSSSE